MGANLDKINFYRDDLDAEQLARYLKSPYLAVDTETMGLDTHRDRLCVVQMCDEAGEVSLVQTKNYQAPNLKKLFEAQEVEKIFHFARFDIAALKHWLDIQVNPVFCTKIASRLARTYTGGHGLKDLCRELVGVEMDKKQQSSDWGRDDLSDEQISYAASDVIYLIEARKTLEVMLKREGRLQLALDTIAFLPTRVELDLAGWGEQDIFTH
uniref:Putative 3'-5' exonuclease family protein n=1 Tax=Magnetococcus massalia (strain MO-1) TaxID=451514 RepID=A0A1S7LP43_MAGMO|nr:Putative 3'-5' exonuclease family protein [Candidatus Magnetococcus massalia]